MVLALAETQRGGHAGAPKRRSRAGLQDGGKHRRRGLGLRAHVLRAHVDNPYYQYAEKTATSPPVLEHNGLSA